MDKTLSIAKATEILVATTRTLKGWDIEDKLKIYSTLENHRGYRLSDKAGRC